MSEQGPPPESVPTGRRPRGRQTVRDMVRSMAVIVALVAVVLLFAPPPGAVDQPQISQGQAVAAVEQAVTVLDRAPLLLVAGEASDLTPAEVPEASDVVAVGEGWRLDYTRTEQVADIDTWRVGVLSPDDRRVDLEQAVDPNEEWLTRADEGRVEAPEPVEVGGLTWSRQVRGDGDTTYLFVGDAIGGDEGLTTAVTATSDSEDLREVVELVATALRG